jgi:hypothetical protein
MRFVDEEIHLNRERERKLLRTLLLVNQGRLKIVSYRISHNN